MKTSCILALTILFALQAHGQTVSPDQDARSAFVFDDPSTSASGGAQRAALALPNLVCPSDDEARAIFDQPGDGAIWVHGANFKARFDRSGFEYIPFLGSDAPRDYPVDFRIESARVGTSELAWQADVDPELDGAQVIYRRGAFDEIYIVGTNSIEQDFVVHERRTSGDLHVVVHTSSELERSDSDLGTAFANERGGVRVGNATTRDDSDRAVRSVTRRVGKSIDIAVPQSELVSASFPLVIDPLVTTWTVTIIAAPTSNFPDTSYDGWTNSWLSVDQETFSATDHDIIARQFNSSGTMLDQQYIDFSTDDWTRPRVANGNALHRFMVVAEVAASTASGSIRARSYTATTHSLGTPFTVSPNKPGHKFTCPDIGGDDNPNGTPPFCVAYLESPQEPGAVQGNFTLNTTLVSPAGTLLSNFAYWDARSEPVRVSKSNGNHLFDTQRWTVAWPTFDVGITFFQIDSSGSHTWPSVDEFSSATGYNSFSVSSLLNGSGFPRTFAIAGCAFGITGIHALSVDSNGQIVASQYGSDTPQGSGVTVETDGTDFYWVKSQPISGLHGFVQNNLYLSTFRLNPDLTTPPGYVVNLLSPQSHVLIAGSTDDESMPSLASMHSSGGGSSNMMCVYKRLAALGGGASILASVLY